MRVLVALLVVASAARAESPPDLRTRKSGADWPTFLGPTADGASPEKGVLTKWPKDGLPVVWEAPVGQGYAPPVVSRGRLFHFDRFGDDNRLTCRNAETGKLLWKFEYPTAYEEDWSAVVPTESAEAVNLALQQDLPMALDPTALEDKSFASVGDPTAPPTEPSEEPADEPTEEPSETPATQAPTPTEQALPSDVTGQTAAETRCSAGRSLDDQ